MTTPADKTLALLAGLRSGFLDELPERCSTLEQLVLRLASPDGNGAFEELLRAVHSLKGTGGTFGLGIISTVCHCFEDMLIAANERGRFDDAFTAASLAYVDLLRGVEPAARAEGADFAAIEEGLAALRSAAARSHHALIAETSPVMVRIYQEVMADLPVRTTVTNNGLIALERLMREPYAFAIIGGELDELKGAAVIAALKMSKSPRRDMPLVLISSRSEPLAAGHDAIVIVRDEKLPQLLRDVVRRLLPMPGAHGKPRC